ncbi:hypothetical protein TIFTF001_006080 [Ficus carica]|uniref:F-box domain-containing protein n=1 Tax=Ficus carica TaxID=3494 RepID=A0AA87ZNG3_FICCA|nr:hypothetical protein TIFTF001_006080 [Ficus carica]
MAESLPWDIVVDILSRLPVKDLLRYRSVSKPFRSLIDGPDFIKLHLKYSQRTTSHLGVVFGGSNFLSWVDLYGALNLTVRRLSYPNDIGDGINFLIGGCNGLLALANRDGDMAIWNPSTKRYWALPVSFPGLSHPSRYFHLVMIGFGYDPISDDYKLLRKINLNDQEKGQDLGFYSEVAIYSVKSKTWKKIDDFPDHFLYRRGHGVLVGHTLHWEANRKSDLSNLIFAFDLAVEDHRVLAMPDGEDVVCCSRLANLGGCLCVAVLRNYNPYSKKSERVDVWAMKEYGVKESWIKLFTVEPSEETGGPFCYVVPVASFKGGGHQILLDLDGERFLLYDMKRKRIEQVKDSTFPGKGNTLVCVESLIGIDGDDQGQNTKKQAKTNKNDQGKKETTKKR